MIAAIGTDGWRPVVWGVGDTLAEAHAEAARYLAEADAAAADVDCLEYEEITEEQFAVIEAGDVSWPVVVPA